LLFPVLAIVRSGTGILGTSHHGHDRNGLSKITSARWWGADASLAPGVLPKQVDIIRGHIDDALASGGRATVRPVSVFVQPTVLVDVPEDSPANTGETFGDSDGDGDGDGEEGCLHGRDGRAGERHLVRPRLDGVLKVERYGHRPAAAVRYDGLREFTYAHSIAARRMKPVLLLTTFARTAKAGQRLRADDSGVARAREDDADPVVGRRSLASCARRA